MSQKLKLLASTGINYVSVQIRRNTHRDGEVCQLIMDDCLTYFKSSFTVEFMGVISCQIQLFAKAMIAIIVLIFAQLPKTIDKN